MTDKLRRLRRRAAMLVAFAGAGCGGGGGGAPPPGGPAPAVTCTVPGEAASVVADTALVVGKAGGAVVAGCSGALTDVAWTQTGGPPLDTARNLLAARSQAISFEPPAAGTYTLRVDFRDATGSARNATVAVVVTDPATPSRVTARVDHAVRAGGKVSLRAWPAAAPGDTLTWQQLEGPAVTLDTSDPNRVLFTAPQVDRDTLLRFRVNLRTGTGATDSDDVLVLVERYAQAPSDPNYAFGDFHVARVYPYKPAGRYAAALARCVYDAQLQWQGAGKNTCSLATLPFLHQDTGGAQPTVAQIMDRVLVSHDWMGEVFEQFIARADLADVRRLLNGVTAIVIGAQVRPSFYYGLIGAIYLDADNFWLTPEQRDAINEAPDFRSDFDRDLAYSGLWRYVVDHHNAFLFFPPTSRLSRSLDYLVFEAGWLLYHELAHAGDFLPPAVRSALDPTRTVWDNVGPRYAQRQLPSDLLDQQLPLTSAVMRGLAQVKFFGAIADATQRSYTPQQVAGFFSADVATDEYNYSTTREDIAMLFEEFMMFQRHGARRDVAITDKIGPGTTGDTLIVRWGQRGRAAEAAVRPRVKLALRHIAPWIDEALVDALPAPLAMRAGESWNANLVLPAAPGSVRPQALATEQARAADAWLLERAQRRPATDGKRGR
jgi:hypothetical protein